MKIFTKILTLILTALGFSTLASCSMYASVEAPYAEVDINATVVDGNQSPIPNARVVLKYLTYRYNPLDTLYTNNEGYLKIVRGTTSNEFDLRLIVEDIRLANALAKDSVDVVFAPSDFKGGNGKLYLGTAKRDVVITLGKKAE